MLIQINENDNYIGFNTNTNDLTNSNDVINTLFHETTNQEQHNKNEQTVLNRSDTIEIIWDMLNYGNKKYIMPHILLYNQKYYQY